MANMVEEILGQIDPDELASRVGTDPETAMDAARKALPALLGGLDLEVQGGKADALAAAALQDHEGRLDQPNPLASVDPAEGQKILGHMFGDRLGTVEQRLGGTSQAGSSIFSKLLPILAPLVMSWLAGRMRGATKPSGGGGGGGGLDDLLGGGGLSDILGGLLGGEKESARQSMPDLGGLFDMFGGGGEGKDAGSNIPDVGDLFGRK